MQKLLNLLFVVIVGLAAVLPATSQERVLAGVGHLMSNALPEGAQPRWYAASYVVSAAHYLDGDAFVFPRVLGKRPEYRLYGKGISPAKLPSVSVSHNPYFGALSYGIHSNSQFVDVLNRASAGYSFRAVTPDPDIETQLPNAIDTTLSSEVTNPIQMGAVAQRRFAEQQRGVEIFSRLDDNIFFGERSVSHLQFRDWTVAQLYNRAGARIGSDVEFILGADIGHVGSSEFVPSSNEHTVDPVWLGLQVSVPQADMFYGARWIGPELDDLPSGPLVGALKVSLRF